MLSSPTVVASCQFAPEILNTDRNVSVMQALAFEAASKGARIIVLPELAISGCALRNVQEAASCAQQRNGWQTQALQPIATNFNAHIVFGCVELCEGKLYNAAIIIGPRGVEGVSRKHNGYGPDRLWAMQSEDMFPIVATAVGRLGCLVCKDVRNNYRESYIDYDPQHKFYPPGSVDTIALPVNWGQSFGYPADAWCDLQESTQTNVIVANRWGKERDMSFKGGSCVISRGGAIHTYGSCFSSDCVVGGLCVS